MPAALYKIPVRIYAIVVLAIALALVLSLTLLSRAVDTAYESRENELRDMTDAAISFLIVLDEQVRAGEIDLETAKQQGRKSLETIRFGDSGYMFANDYDNTVVAHPMLPDWVGTDKNDYQDVKGKKLFQEMQEVARRDGQGAVYYWFRKPGATEPERKIGYVQDFKPWGWIIGTGAYVSDIEADVAHMRNVSIMILVTGLVLLVVVSTLLIRTVTRPLASFLDSMNEVENGRYDVQIEAANRRDEIGVLGRSLAEFRDRLIKSEKMSAKREEERLNQDRVVKELSEAMQFLSAGNLTHSLDTPFPEAYEGLRRNFNATVDNLNDLMGSVVQNATEIHARAEEISSASDELSQRTENQAATLEETAAAMDEMTSSVRAAAKSAAEVEKVVGNARQDAETSGRVVTEAIGAMSEIKKSSDEITQIIGVIDDIAFQTNLLALNAGVEAARAGEAGRGFAVVASEVRALAQRSSDAAKEIKGLISASSDHVESGVSLVNRTGEALTDIVDRVGNIAELISGIASGAQDQSVGLGEINVGVTQLDKVTQQNAAMVEEATAASTTLKQEASHLQSLVARFEIKGGPSNGVMASVPVPQFSRSTPVESAIERGFADERPARASNDASWQDF